MNSFSNGLIKQLFAPNSPKDHLPEHKIEDLKRTCWPDLESQGFCETVVLIVTK